MKIGKRIGEPAGFDGRLGRIEFAGSQLARIRADAGGEA